MSTSPSPPSSAAQLSRSVLHAASRALRLQPRGALATPRSRLSGSARNRLRTSALKSLVSSALCTHSRGHGSPSSSSPAHCTRASNRPPRPVLRTSSRASTAHRPASSASCPCRSIASDSRCAHARRSPAASRRRRAAARRRTPARGMQSYTVTTYCSTSRGAPDIVPP
eukprot:333706-Prymnesium_polylepis.1